MRVAVILRVILNLWRWWGRLLDHPSQRQTHIHRRQSLQKAPRHHGGLFTFSLTHLRVRTTVTNYNFLTHKSHDINTSTPTPIPTIGILTTSLSRNSSHQLQARNERSGRRKSSWGSWKWHGCESLIVRDWREARVASDGGNRGEGSGEWRP